MEQTQDCTAGLVPSEGYMEAGGLNWHYLQWNSTGRRRILLLHGVTSDAHAWWRLGPALARQDAQVVAVDMPGHGQTEVSSAGTASRTTARQLAQFVAALGWQESGYRLAGHSWGGVVSLTMARYHGKGLDRVALLDPALHLTAARVDEVSASYAAQVGQPKLSRADYYQQSLVTNSRWPDDCDHFWKAGAMEAFDPTTVRDFYRSNRDQNIIALLGEVNIPILLMISDETLGGVLSAQDQAACRAALSPTTGQIVKLPGVGHNLQREDYAGTLQSLQPFLSVE